MRRYRALRLMNRVDPWRRTDLDHAVSEATAKTRTGKLFEWIARRESTQRYRPWLTPRSLQCNNSESKFRSAVRGQCQ